MQKVSTTLNKNTDIHQSLNYFLDDVQAWIDHAISDNQEKLPIRNHDHLTFTTAWEPYINTRGHNRALAFMTEKRDAARASWERKGLWQHGYWKNQEAHHGTEHFELFMATLWRLNPSDGKTVRQFEDMAEHLGNWSSDVPDWFDWDKGIYHSMHFGTKTVSDEQAAQVNIADHFRCLNLSIMAFEMTGHQRYRDLFELYGANWARAILARENNLPVGLNENGGVFELSETEEAARLAVARLAPDTVGLLNRAENFLCSDAPRSLLKLWKLTGEGMYKQASEKLIDALCADIESPTGGPVADAVRVYWEMTGDNQFNDRVLAVINRKHVFSITELAMVPKVKRDRRPPGVVGIRKDMPGWYENGDLYQANPITMAAAACMTGDEELAAKSIELARAYFTLARGVYPHGEDHGCSARSVSAIARGHGRNNHAGVLTAVLAPVQKYFG